MKNLKLKANFNILVRNQFVGNIETNGDIRIDEILKAI